MPNGMDGRSLFNNQLPTRLRRIITVEAAGARGRGRISA